MNDTVDAKIAKVVMPAIYRLPFPSSEGKWGWHRAKELVEAVNNILTEHGKKSLTTAEIVETYPTVNLLRKEDPGKFWTSERGRWRSFAGRDGTLRQYSSHCNPGGDWLGVLVADDCYIPARIGMELLELIKKSINVRDILLQQID